MICLLPLCCLRQSGKTHHSVPPDYNFDDINTMSLTTLLSAQIQSGKRHSIMPSMTNKLQSGDQSEPVNKMVAKCLAFSPSLQTNSNIGLSEIMQKRRSGTSKCRETVEPIQDQSIRRISTLASMASNASEPWLSSEMIRKSGRLV